MVTSLNRSTPARDIGYQMDQYICGRITAGANGPAILSAKIGTIPAGAIITSILSKVNTAIVGTTPVFSLGTTPTGQDVLTTIALTIGAVVGAVPLVGIVMPLAADTDIYANITGTPTAGDAWTILTFVKPLS